MFRLPTHYILWCSFLYTPNFVVSKVDTGGNSDGDFRWVTRAHFNIPSCGRPDTPNFLILGVLLKNLLDFSNKTLHNRGMKWTQRFLDQIFRAFGYYRPLRTPKEFIAAGIRPEDTLRQPQILLEEVGGECGHRVLVLIPASFTDGQQGWMEVLLHLTSLGSSRIAVRKAVARVRETGEIYKAHPRHAEHQCFRKIN